MPSMEKSSRIVINHHKASGYECRTCGKSFDTYQALGGHQGIHNKVDENFLSLNIFGPKTSGLHRCKTCSLEFESGPALGGHMTRHRIGRDLVSMERKEAVESDMMVEAVEVPQLMAEEEEKSNVRRELILAAKEWRLCI